MTDFFILLKAQFKNKFRLGADKSKRGTIALVIMLSVSYVAILGSVLYILVLLKDYVGISPITEWIYFAILLTAALIVLVFGIVNLVSVLYLSKDTDFYSALPVKASTVFAAKMAFVYICETAIVAIVALPLLLAFGIIVKAWAWYYVITILMLPVIPAFPLVIATIFAIPAMYIASKLKNRNIIPLLFYMLLFGGFFGAYIYLLSSMSGADAQSITAVFEGINVVSNIFYPYKALSAAACAVRSFGLGAGASLAVNLAIFVSVSAALIGLLYLGARFMYSNAVKMNNQTDNSKAKKGSFKSTSSVRALIKREWLSSFRTTQTAFQCFGVLIIPIIVTIIMNISFGNAMSGSSDIPAEFLMPKRFPLLLSTTCLCAILACVANGASTTFSREGNAMASLKILPINGKALIKSKIAAWCVFVIPSSSVAVAVSCAMNFDLEYALLSIFSLIPLSAAFVVFGALWDLTKPKLNWTDPMQAVKHNTHVLLGQLISIAVGMALMLLTMALFMNGVDINTVGIAVWACIYAELAAFTIVDIVLYGRVEKYYDRITA